MTRSRLTARVSGHGRTEDKVIEADVKELSCQMLDQILSIQILKSPRIMIGNQELKIQRKMGII